MPAERVLLFTQCLQNDFVRPLGADERLPNALHIGRDEARRVGEPLERFLRAFATAAAGRKHASVHIRDWHDASDARQRAHLEHFGPHCLRGTEGARFIAGVEKLLESDPDAFVIDSPGLTDFEGTALREKVEAFLGDAPRERVKVGILGVWTDVKVHYLAYDLATRMGLERIAVSGALVASRSRSRHRAALEHMREMLGVAVLDSIPEFLAWLEVDASVAPPEAARRRFGTAVTQREGDPPLEDEERDLIGWLFRDGTSVRVARLGGGFSGSRVYRTQSLDRAGRSEVPYVVKVDTHAKIAKERVAVESVEGLLGAASPRIAEFVDGERLGAIKYGFASMHRGEPRTLLSRMRQASTPEEVATLMAGAIRILERLHQTPHLERINLFQHFTYKPEYAEGTLRLARALAGADHESVRTLERFYARLPDLLDEDPRDVHAGMIHGDLNLANLLLDEAANCWMVDYFHTGVGPILQDIAKLENDLRFIAFPPLDPRVDGAIALLHGYLDGLGATDPRGYRIAALRYAAHTLGFDECDEAQKKAALGHAAMNALLLMKE